MIKNLSRIRAAAHQMRLVPEKSPAFIEASHLLLKAVESSLPSQEVLDMRFGDFFQSKVTKDHAGIRSAILIKQVPGTKRTFAEITVEEFVAIPAAKVSGIYDIGKRTLTAISITLDRFNISWDWPKTWH